MSVRASAVAALLLMLAACTIKTGDPGELPPGCLKGHSEYHDSRVVGMCDDQRGVDR